MMTEKKNKKKTLKRVEIPSGTWKYVLIQLGDDSYLVRGREGATYHADVRFFYYEFTLKSLQQALNCSYYRQLDRHWIF